MTLYNENTDAIEDVTTIETNQGTLYVDKMTTTALGFYGYYPITEDEQHNERYYINTKQAKLENRVYQITYDKSEKPVHEIRVLMELDLDIATEKYKARPDVASQHGFTVRGGAKSARGLAIAEARGKPTVRDTSGVEHTLNPKQYSDLMQEIDDKEFDLDATSWSKFDDVQAMGSAAECDLYENEPYIDENGDTQYKNNIKEWE